MKNQELEEVQRRLSSQWSKTGLNLFEIHSNKGRYVIDTPPPTISGDLHLGHAFSYSHIDFIARYQRMRGLNVFFPLGFDENGLPTERLVEKLKSVKAADVPRSEFINMCKEVTGVFRQNFRNFFDTLGCSFARNLEYGTLDFKSVQLSQASFLDLFQKELLYRKESPMLWDTIDRTALAQAEIEDKVMRSEMHYISFRGAESPEELVVATTRPEMISACVALLFSPDDERYLHLSGKFAITPILSQKVPIIADEMVKKDKGTGLVMCCTFGDELDLKWQMKYDLPLISIIDVNGSMKNTGLPHIDGLKVRGARVKILETLRAEGALLRSEPISHMVKCAERSGAPIEIIPTTQWFVKLIENKELFKKFANKVSWYPESAKNKFDSWADGISWDWCISRQRYFGVPFPVWYSKVKGEDGKIIIPKRSQLPVDPAVDLPDGYSREDVAADTDVMDTWATSALTVQRNLCTIYDGVSENIGTLADNGFAADTLTADLRPQSHEIIRTWTFYSIVKACYHDSALPWRNIMISGWCLAEDRSKMSKSKGNAADPDNVINTYGSDALRYWAAKSDHGRDSVFTIDVVKTGRKLVNKLYNAASFVKALSTPPGTPAFPQTENLMDLWMISLLHKTLAQYHEYFAQLNYHLSINVVESLFRSHFCDNYLEIVKARVYSEISSGSHQTANVLKYVLYHICIMLAPFMPYISDYVYQELFHEGKSVHASSNHFDISQEKINTTALKRGDEFVEILACVRKAKSQKKISIKKNIKSVILSFKSYEDSPYVIPAENDLKSVCNAERILAVRTMTDADLESPSMSIKLIL